MLKCLLLCVVPGPVPPLQIPLNIAATSATFMWDMPLIPNGEILNYRVNILIISSIERTGLGTLPFNIDCIVDGRNGVDRNFIVESLPTTLTVDRLSESINSTHNVVASLVCCLVASFSSSLHTL